MNCGHESLYSDTDQVCQAGGSARGISDHLEGVVLLYGSCPSQIWDINRRDSDD